MDPNAAAEFLSIWGYPAFVVLLLATGFGSPIPEDLLLLVGGYLISADVFSWQLVLPLAMIGVVGSDCILYVAGRHLRTRSIRGPRFRRLIRPARLRLATRWFGRMGDRSIFVARLVPGTRAVTFITAGLRGVAPVRFLILDVLGALVWVPLLLFSGGLLGEQIGGLHRILGWIARGAEWAILLGILLLIAWWWWGREESKL
jgi:membrane protein DedA with SNARE-associated domain